jgi:hypothetical protein
MFRYDKYTAILDFIANRTELETWPITKIMLRWGWVSKSITYKLILAIKDGTEPDIKAVDDLVHSYLQAVSKEIPEKPIKRPRSKPIKEDPQIAVIPEVIIPETAAVDNKEVDPLFSDEPDDIGLQYPYPSNVFKNAWDLWIKYKWDEKKQKYKKLETEQTAINKLFKNSFDNEQLAVDMIECSIANTWSGIYADQSVRDRYPQYFRRSKKPKKEVIQEPNPADTEWTR